VFVLGRSALVGDELAAGHLVRPFELSLPAGFAYYVVYSQRALQRPIVRAFRDWLMRASARLKTASPLPTSVGFTGQPSPFYR
jgi:DNA-binding transcriptional LysR family regulator